MVKIKKPPNNDSKTEELIDELQQIAGLIKDARKDRRNCRPIVVEFAGSPKSGKTSCITALDLFFRRNGYSTKLIGEKAHIAPIENKTNPLFNLWTITSTLSDLTAVLGGESSKQTPDIILVDRGIFDAFCWFSWLQKNRYLEKENLLALQSFLFMPKWIDYFDLILVFKTEPTKSLEREHKMLLTKKQGSIMNTKVLGSFNDTLGECYNDNSGKFKSIRLINADKEDIYKLNHTVTLATLKALFTGAKENVGFVDEKHIKNEQKTVFSLKRLGIGGNEMEFMERLIVEADPTKIQFVPITVITNVERNKIFVVRKNKKSGSPTSPEHKKYLPYIGGHVRQEDRPVGVLPTIGVSPIMIATFNKSLQREIKEEIGVDHVPALDFNSMSIWIHNKERSKQHIAICELWEVDFDSFKPKLDPTEFSTAKKENIIMTLDELKSKGDHLEEWGIAILKYFFNVEIPISINKTLFDDID